MVCTAPSIVTAKSILSPFLGRCPAHLKKAETDDKAGWFAEKKWNIVEFQSMARPCCRISWLQPLMILACGYESRELSWSFWEGSPHDLAHAKRIPGCKQALAVARKYSGIYTPICMDNKLAIATKLVNLGDLLQVKTKVSKTSFCPIFWVSHNAR